MKLPALSILAATLVLLASSLAKGGLAEATDYDGLWTSGSQSDYVAGSSPDYWVGQTVASLDGVDAAEGRLDYSAAEHSWIETSVTGPTTLYFSYRAVGFSGSYGGNFSLVLNGEPPVSLIALRAFGRTTTDWREKALLIPAGNATVRWQLNWFRGVDDGRAYVDQVWTSNDARPRITNPVPPATQFGLTFDWQVPVASAIPVTLTATDLPPGLALEAGTRIISGTPSTAGEFEATLTALNASGRHIAKVPFVVEPGSTTIPEGVDAAAFIFTQPGTGTAWSGVTGFGHDGVDSARGLASTTLEGANSTLSTDFSGPGILTFWYRCEADDANPGADRTVLNLYVGIPPSASQPTQQLTETTWTKVTLQLPAGMQTISWRSYWSVFGSDVTQRFVYLDELAFVPDPPEIVVQVEPLLTNLVDGGSQAFGNLFVNAATSLSFTIRNTGPGNLEGLTTTIDGAHAADFSLKSSPIAPVSGPDGTTNFTIQFAPTSRGAKTAALRIANNDEDESPFDISLTGTGFGITSQPVSQVVNQGDSVSFSVTVDGPPPSFQWRKDGVDVPGAVARTLVISSAQPWQIGEYDVRVTAAAGSVLSATASLGLTDVPSGIWRGLVACYPFDGNPDDVCRPGEPAYLISTTELVSDAQRGGVAHIRGKGFLMPPLDEEPADLRGPGGYIRIPRPPLGDGQPFTASFVIKEEGYSYWHGESFLTMGEGESAIDLIGHYWIGSFGGTEEHYGGHNGAVEPFVSDFVLDGSMVTLSLPWTTYTVVAQGDAVQLYRNGQLMGSTPYKKDTIGDFFIGRHWWENGGIYSTRLVAKFDDLRMYNRALTPPEVQLLYSLVQVTPLPGSYEAWMGLHGLSGTDADLSADPDHDGLTNWEEYCFGTSPEDGRESPLKAGVVGTTLTLEWLETEGVRYVLTESSDLLPLWTDSPRVPTPSANQTGVPSGYERMQVSIPVPQVGQPFGGRFLRAEATKVP